MNYSHSHRPNLPLTHNLIVYFANCWSCVGRHNFHVFSLNYNTDLDDWISDCLLTSMAAIQAEDIRFLIVSDLNGYSEAKCQFSIRNRDVLMNAQFPYKWWSTLKLAVFRSSSSLPPLVGGVHGQACELVGKAGLLSDNFDSMQSREYVDLLLTCHLFPGHVTFGLKTLMVALTHWACFLLS